MDGPSQESDTDTGSTGEAAEADHPLPTSTTNASPTTSTAHNVATGSAMLAEEKRHIAYPKKRTSGAQPAVPQAANTTANASALLAQEKRRIAYPKSRSGTAVHVPTEVPTEVHQENQMMANTTKAAEASALLAEEKRHIAYPRSDTSNRKNRPSINQGDWSGPTTAVNYSPLLQAEKGAIIYPRGETNRTVNTVLLTSSTITTVPPLKDSVVASQRSHEASPSAIEQQDHQKEQETVSDMLSNSAHSEANRNDVVDANTNTIAAPEHTGTVQHDDNFGIMPLPRLERTTANRRAQVQPGAYADGGNFQATEENLETAETYIEPDTTQPPTIEPEYDNSGLAVANLVAEDETTDHQDLPQAQDYNPDNINHTREEKMKQFKTKVFLGVIFLLAIILILVAIVTPSKKQDNLVPTISPISAIQEVPGSPQSSAFRWLLDEIDILQHLAVHRVVQRFVLATVYFANSGDQWSFSDSWLNHSVHECLWYSSLEDYYSIFAEGLFLLDHISPCEQDPAGYLEEGILYQGDGILKHFWTSFNGLMGSGIPPELYLLTELKSLALDGLNLTSTIPEELSGLSNLEYLSMMYCGLDGSIPEIFGRLSKLEVTYFGFNSLTGTIPQSLYSLSNSMRAILLTENLLTGQVPTELGLLTNLEGLSLATNLFTGTIPTELGKLTGLEFLFLNNLILSGAIPNELAGLNDMVLLQLEVSGLSGTIPRWLGNMTSMESVTLAYNSFTGTIPTELGLIPKLFILWLGGNALSGTIPSEIGSCEQMLVFLLHTNNLTGTIPTELGQFTEGFFQFWLHDNDLTGTVPPELGNVSFPPPYGQVYLHGNDLSGIIPESLCSANDLTFDCSSQLCGCDLCNCSGNRTSLILESETANEDGQVLSKANQTEGNQTEP
ncbi:Inherit from bctoNOG: RHS repeat-associated core domain-containing protein [Seminavis robusta]|uniref:Inherit from bctoNOG: RHS repeat-associated core domain-containing protein n=1 Tax=Seminavis robusta TaxID=568900 RepID=A0A9N8H9N4_9STRA|nr:Inherit from bctoNOG: RHS repeat-associated core domain-containing protein [Seminavis robusta]|eukprot:Sro283_g107840.1 Inherit from bctoNOG: RHS repeat-associated core domain-containing protein (897) ;mRNA; f:72869-75969